MNPGITSCIGPGFFEPAMAFLMVSVQNRVVTGRTATPSLWKALWLAWAMAFSGMLAYTGPSPATMALYHATTSLEARSASITGRTAFEMFSPLAL